MSRDWNENMHETWSKNVEKDKNEFVYRSGSMHGAPASSKEYETDTKFVYLSLHSICCIKVFILNISIILLWFCVLYVFDALHELLFVIKLKM